MTQSPLDLKDWRFTVDFEDIAWAIFDREVESANALGRRPLEELNEIVQWMVNEAPAKGVRGLGILSGKSGSFIVGA
ncbi:MAG: 3-hydroxyacyl-CoA dehydrogenase, partial [Pseudomonadota bacterium]